MSSELLTERQGAVLVLTISDPASRNTLSEQAIAAGIEALNIAESADDVRCAILRGAGSHFCAGGNLQGLQERRRAGPPAQVRMLEHLHQLVEAMRAFPKPLIAAVEGAAAGAGFSLALACDLIVAAEDARFILSYGRIGLSPDAGATWHLARALPRPLAQQLVWLAEPASARQLEAWGLVSRVADPGQALPEALRLAEQLAAMAPNALASAKELLDAAPGRTLTAQLAAERDHFVENLFHANAAEGLAAFGEKRAPRFR
ncbi:MAG: enoyl-CoA hydratase/isomerase family protein [Proteobacteria bacterium]|nr:enoyl-CoA hydratase/isomerase family protein [Pseudomonadota bacterium]